MRRWLLVTLCVLAGLLLIYAAYGAFVAYGNGTKAAVTIHAGQHNDGTMYYRCSDASGGAIVSGTDQCTITVHKRDKLAITVISDDGPGRTHDFKLQGAPYFLYPAGIEMEIQDGSQTASFVAWATGDYTFVCELAGHESAGMHGTLHVID